MPITLLKFDFIADSSHNRVILILDGSLQQNISNQEGTSKSDTYIYIIRRTRADRSHLFCLCRFELDSSRWQVPTREEKVSTSQDGLVTTEWSWRSVGAQSNERRETRKTYNFKRLKFIQNKWPGWNHGIRSVESQLNEHCRAEIDEPRGDH